MWINQTVLSELDGGALAALMYETSYNVLSVNTYILLHGKQAKADNCIHSSTAFVHSPVRGDYLLKKTL